MGISKTKNGSYRLRVYIPDDVQGKLGIGKRFEKRFKTRREAKEAEIKLAVDIENARLGKASTLSQRKGDILFKDFYKDIWLEPYKAGQATATIKPPTAVTIFQTENLFRLQILPVLGNYSIDHLNENKQLVLSLLTPLSNSYANFKSIRGYVNSVLDWAEELEYIQVNKVKKTISRIKANKKLALKESKKFEDLTLNEEELKQWLQAFDEDLKNDRMELKDYALFYTTFFLSDRKSETYALQWKHINYKKNEILIEQTLDKFGNLKSTKGNKKTLFKAPKELINILTDWKIEQKSN